MVIQAVLVMPIWTIVVTILIEGEDTGATAWEGIVAIETAMEIAMPNMVRRITLTLIYPDLKLTLY